MADKFHDKYRIAPARWQNWDYRWAGAYFITICTRNREHYFGVVENGKMNLSKQGILADIFWHEIKNHAKNVDLDEFIVMPNHIHGILILDNIGNDNDNGHGANADANNDNGNDVDDADNVETRHALSLQSTPKNQSTPPTPSNQTIGQQRFQNQGKNSVSSIVGSYKSAVTRHANRLKLPFDWQSRFHEHVIRDAAEYQRIKNYIANNPANWKDDKFYK
ncbi:MAG TPA: hypothetical protein VFW07_18300 [Parafilimonas sp.]|nr:hypothetical protein [Parafilimonas sp.]